MTCGVLTIDRQGRITTLNDHARAILELEGKDVVGLPCREALAHCPRVADVLLESFRMSSPPSRAELELRSADHHRRSLGYSISMIEGEGGGPVEGAALFFKDLTKVEEQEERERLRDRLAALGEMAAQMAHEIRNPLTSIEVSAALMKRRLASKGEKTDLLEKLAADAARIEATIAGCLEYARPLARSRQRVAPVELLDEAIEQSKVSRGSQGVRVERAYAAGLPDLSCDRMLLRETFVNILNNAFEAMGAEGTLTVAATLVAGLRGPGPAMPVPGGAGETPEQCLLVRVSDTGPGIPADLRDRIFYPFFTTKTSGSGIGLAMARKVVESHGGWLDVESEPGRGATFILKIPVMS
jgi:signal transduction histidine kinase